MATTYTPVSKSAESAETWATITSTWGTETATWASIGGLTYVDLSKNTASFANISKATASYAGVSKAS